MLLLFPLPATLWLLNAHFFALLKVQIVMRPLQILPLVVGFALAHPYNDVYTSGRSSESTYATQGQQDSPQARTLSVFPLPQGIERRQAADFQKGRMTAEEAAQEKTKSKKGVMWRGDSRDPKEVFATGFQAQGTNRNLESHLRFEPEDVKLTKEQKSGFISLTRNEPQARKYAFGRSGNEPKPSIGYVYELTPDKIPDGFYIPKIYNPKLDGGVNFNREFAVDGPIPGESIRGAYEISFDDPKYKKYIPNKGYVGKDKDTCIISKKRGLCTAVSATDPPFDDPEAAKKGAKPGEQPKTGEQPKKKPKLGEQPNERPRPAKAGEQPKPAKPATDVSSVGKDMVVAAERISREEFGTLSAKYGMESVVEKWGKTVSEVRTKLQNYKPASPNPAGFKAPLSNLQKGLGVAGMGLYVVSVTEAFSNNMSAWDRAAVVSSIVPLVGCGVQLAVNEIQHQPDYVDTALCFIADGFLLSGVYAPIGLGLHAARAIRSYFKTTIPPGPTKLQLKALRDDGWQRFIDQRLYTYLSSEAFGYKLGSTLSIETFQILSDGAWAIGVLKASSENAQTLTTDPEEKVQLESFFKDGLNKVEERLPDGVINMQRNLLFGLPEKVRDESQNSIKNISDEYKNEFIKSLPVVKEVEQFLRDDPLPLPSNTKMAYFIGQSMNRNVGLPTVPAPKMKDTGGHIDPSQISQQPPGNGNPGWGLDPLTLKPSHFLKANNIADAEAKSIGVQAGRDVMDILQDKRNERDMDGGLPPLRSKTTQELRMLMALKMGGIFTLSKSNGTSSSTLPLSDSMRMEMATAIASMLELEGDEVRLL